MPHFSEEEIQAREDGRDAYDEGKRRTENPFSMLSQKNLWTCWDEGWEERETEDGEDEESEESD